MSQELEKTITEQKAEIERLRAKNAELLDKLAKAKNATREDGANVEDLQGRLKDAEDELYILKVANPRRDLIRSICGGDDLADCCQRELERIYTFTDDGGITDKEGNAVTIPIKDKQGNITGNKEVRFDKEGIYDIAKHHVPLLNHFLLGLQSSGGGACGPGPVVVPNNWLKEEKSKPDNSQKFGIR